MLFSSQEFLILFGITFVLYYSFFKRWQVQTLIASSIVFYAYGQAVLLALLLTSIVINAFISYRIIYQTNKTKRKSWATTGVILNLAAIAFFKYSSLFSKSLGVETTSIGAFLISLPLPLGISFFTFEGISLVVDTYKEKELEGYQSFVVRSFNQHLKNTLLFVSFFPHLIAGPILKAHEFYPQIGLKRFSDIQWDRVFRQLVAGYFLKMVIADNLKDQTFWIKYPYFLQRSSEDLVTMLFGYSIQIFADFAGYSLIALGLATMFGYELKGNFNFPYMSTSFGEFWRRWHISLSSFLREYLYIPLGGNKKGKIRTYLNLFITMFLGGLWHGAAWSYAVWGIAHGLFLALERFVNDSVLIQCQAWYWKSLKLILVFTLVTLAWLLFKLPEFGQALDFLSAVVHNTTMKAQSQKNLLILLYTTPVIVYHCIAWLKENGKWHYFSPFEYWIWGFMLFLLATNSGSSADFIYFQF